MTREQKLDVLKCLLVESNKRFEFWAERIWAALRASVGGILAVAGLSIFKQGNFISALALIFALVGIATASITYIRKNHDRVQETFEMISQIQRTAGS